jgi:two-component system OmpR family response regulator
MPAVKKPLVLIIDPDEEFTMQLARCLSPKCQLLSAGNLQEGWVIALQNRPHIVLMEVNQPDGDGFQWIQSARSQAWSKDMAIACITTRRTVQDKIKGLRIGADDYLIKPVDMNAIYARVILLIRCHQMNFALPRP